MGHTRERRYGHTASARFSPGSRADDLASAKDRVKRANELWTRLYREAKRMPQHGLILASKDRMGEFREDLLKKAQLINRKLDPPLRDADVMDVTASVVDRVAVWDHSPERQRKRQQQQAAKRRRDNRWRDSRIRRFFEDGMSPERIARKVGMSRSGVRHVLDRDLPPRRRRGKNAA